MRVALFTLTAIFSVFFNSVPNKHYYRKLLISLSCYQQTTTLAIDLCTYRHKMSFNISLRSIETIVLHIA